MKTRKQEYTNNYDQQHVAKLKKRKLERRNWLDLPWDVMILIMLKLGVVDVVFNAQKVCRLWREASKQRILFRSLNFQGIENYFTRRMEDSYVDFVIKAVNKSGGHLVQLSLNEPFVVRRIVNHLIVKHSLDWLKSLKLGPRMFITEECLSIFCRYLPFLEEFDVYFHYFPMLAVDQLGRYCPKLTSFRLDKYNCYHSFDDEVAAITRNMPQVRSLTLTTSFLTDKGLQTLLDGCPNLEYLDFRECAAAKVTERMRNMCTSRIGKCWFPNKSSWTRVIDMAKLKKWYQEK